MYIIKEDFWFSRWQIPIDLPNFLLLYVYNEKTYFYYLNYLFTRQIGHQIVVLFFVQKVIKNLYINCKFLIILHFPMVSVIPTVLHYIIVLKKPT